MAACVMGAKLEEALPNGFAGYPWHSIQRLPKPQIARIGETLISEDTPANNVVLLRDGRVKLTSSGERNRKMILGIRSGGWILGAQSAFLNASPGYSAVALTDCEISVYSSAAFLRELEVDSILRSFVDMILAMETQSQIAAQMELRCENAQMRLEHLLNEIEAISPDGSGLPITQIEMAQLLAMSPEHLCRMLGKPRSRTHPSSLRAPIYCLPPRPAQVT